jgi:hypothetical protein
VEGDLAAALRVPPGRVRVLGVEEETEPGGTYVLVVVEIRALTPEDKVSFACPQSLWVVI